VPLTRAVYAKKRKALALFSYPTRVVDWAQCHLSTVALFGCADKPAEKHCWLICSERKTLFRLKKQAKKDGL
jgi:hypothetical protein